MNNLECHSFFTIEPGCYIRPSDEVPKEFWGIGVRIEDDVLVTSNGYDVLSKNAPKEIGELEAIIGKLNESDISDKPDNSKVTKYDLIVEEELITFFKSRGFQNIISEEHSSDLLDYNEKKHS